jgi:hypothetical protein
LTPPYMFAPLHPYPRAGVNYCVQCGHHHVGCYVWCCGIVDSNELDDFHCSWHIPLKNRLTLRTYQKLDSSGKYVKQFVCQNIIAFLQ